MNRTSPSSSDSLSRRALLQAGSIGLLGLDMGNAGAFQAETVQRTADNVIFIFLSGGLSQLDSFDMKPEAPEEIRGEFRPVQTTIPGLQVCEHLPKIAAQCDKWSLVRSLTHYSNEHNEAHTLMLTGRSKLPPGWQEKKPQPTDWPGITSTAGRMITTASSSLPQAIVVPQQLKNMNQGGVVIPGQFGGTMGTEHDPWFIEASPYRGNDVKGAYPDWAYRRRSESKVVDHSRFHAPTIKVPDGLSFKQLEDRVGFLKKIERQQRSLEKATRVQELDRYRQAVVSLLSDEKVKHAFDVVNADDRVLDRYGRNLFGWTLLMARRLIDAGVTFIQANLGNFNTWDLHGGIFKISKELLYPPADQAISALLQDLSQSGRLERTMVVVAGEFGRTPKIFTVPNAYKTPGRDHWGALNTVMFAGGGVKGGQIVGASDRIAAYPSDNPKRPENFAATIYRALGFQQDAHWQDSLGRPHHIYHGSPINELFT